MQIDILTPEGKIFSGEGEAVQMPGVDGLFEVLNNHAPLISALSPGRLRIKQNGQETLFNVESGFVEVLRNQVNILVQGAEAA